VSKKTSATEEGRSDPGTGKPGHAEASVNAALSASQKVDLYRLMVRIRRFEERSLRAYQAKKIGGFLHLYIGQEAVAVGCCSLMGKDDHVITAYRDHGHAIAVGMELNPLMAELYGKATGCSKGKGGSMHFFDPARNYWGGHGVVGGQVPLGAGLAYGLKYKGLKGACMTFMGDGAVNQGAVHEAYNLAALWDLPVIFVIENNGYSMGTSQARSSAGDLARRAEGYGMAWGTCDGHDLYEVRAFMAPFLEKARAQCKPAVVEIRTYRYRGHSAVDAQLYRSKEEVLERKTNDPVKRFPRWLLEIGVVTQADLDRMESDAQSVVAGAVAFAEESPEPPIEDLYTDVYVDGTGFDFVPNWAK